MPISPDYINALRHDIISRSTKLLINDIDEFPISTSNIDGDNVNISVLIDNYNNPDITNIKLLDSSDVVIYEKDVSTFIDTSIDINEVQFRFVIKGVDI